MPQTLPLPTVLPDSVAGGSQPHVVQPGRGFG